MEIPISNNKSICIGSDFILVKDSNTEEESAYWDIKEVLSDPGLVFGAIFGAIYFESYRQNSISSIEEDNFISVELFKEDSGIFFVFPDYESQNIIEYFYLYVHGIKYTFKTADFKNEATFSEFYKQLKLLGNEELIKAGLSMLFDKYGVGNYNIRVPLEDKFIEITTVGLCDDSTDEDSVSFYFNDVDVLSFDLDDNLEITNINIADKNVPLVFKLISEGSYIDEWEGK